MQKRFDIIGIGSSVVDFIYKVDSILGRESKGFVRESRQMPGGVVVNHLAWASLLGLRAGLFGIGGDDDNGRFLRQAMDGAGVDHSHFLKSGSRTSTARVYVDGRGERAIYMDPAATADTRPADIRQFLPLMRQSRYVSTEVSQLKLATALEVLRLARRAGCQTFLDLDLPPSYATGPGKLGNAVQLKAALKEATYLKASLEAAAELVGRQKPEATAAALHRWLGKPAGAWVALTAGSQGSALADGRRALFVPARRGVRVKDSTGAGDAFMGGLIAGTARGLGIRELGQLGNAAGAANVGQWGAVPDQGARARVAQGIKGRAAWLGSTAGTKPAVTAGGAAQGHAFMSRALGELRDLSGRLDPGSFAPAVELIRSRDAKGGRLHVTGIGKCEYVAGYIASSYSSTGWPSYFLHGTEAVHGASGQVQPGEVVIAISNSGETPELKATVLALRRNGARILGVSGRKDSWLARNSDVFLFSGVAHEGDGLNLAPRASILAQILVLSALGVELQGIRRFTKERFVQYHPGGSLGKR